MAAVFCVELRPKSAEHPTPYERSFLNTLADIGLDAIDDVRIRRRFFIEGEVTADRMEQMVVPLLTDPVVEEAELLPAGPARRESVDGLVFEIHPRPGVMDPVAESVCEELRQTGLQIDQVRTATRYLLRTALAPDEVLSAVRMLVSNDCIEQVVLGTAGVGPAPTPKKQPFELRHVPIRELDHGGLERLSRDGHLFLSITEMETIQAHFRTLGREPTDLELETLAQTWSEHCVHKTLKSAYVYEGAPFGAIDADAPPIQQRYGNLLRDTIAAATQKLMAAKRGPRCLSVFVDNAGVIDFEQGTGIAFKVETHNHPSAIEPYGGAATGAGGCIRDVIGCGLGAQPIANTDVFCVAPSDWPLDGLPKGVLHPKRVLRSVVQGVADYGNRMGIPTVNGAVHFDPRFLANPLVFCGCVGLIPHECVHKEPQPGDRIVVLGGRTGRDGIHGATFSSAELTDSHGEEFSHAVQIGNAITEKKVLDAVLAARDHSDGCLFTAITDCGAGGLSSAVGEMGAEIGAVVDLEQVPLKYAGLRYDEIWISEAQERMVLAVPPDRLERFLATVGAEECEATVIGTFGTPESARLIARYAGTVVGELDMHFMHEGVPKRELRATWRARAVSSSPDRSDTRSVAESFAELRARLSDPNVASKSWITRKYDHEVLGGSVIKPLMGPGRGPSDAAVLRPILSSDRGIALGCGLKPELADIDPYWMAAAGIDEALRNVVCVGGDPRETAILDNFCWGGVADEHQLGGLVRASQACHDFAIHYGLPFISGKDSLNNQFAPEAGDIERLLAVLREMSERDDALAGRVAEVLPLVEAELQRSGRLVIPSTLLISAVSIVPDVRKCVSSDLKEAGNALVLLPGFPSIGFAADRALVNHHGVADAIARGLVRACHDVSDAGWLGAVAEMTIGGQRGVFLEIDEPPTDPFADRVGGYVIETSELDEIGAMFTERGVDYVLLGRVSEDSALVWSNETLPLAALADAWRAG